MVNNVSFIGDELFFLKSFIGSNLPDPISSIRPANEKFIMTSYPTRPVRYPLITIKDINARVPTQLGFQSQAMPLYVEVEIRVWGRNIAEKDQLTGSIFSMLKDAQIGSPNTFQYNNLHDLRLTSMINIDESEGPKSKIMTWQNLYIAT